MADKKKRRSLLAEAAEKAAKKKKKKPKPVTMPRPGESKAGRLVRDTLKNLKK
tara:strand:+ start:5095 stop:5253 length:159 start_codon:yes stop_codon:yes gene_type:complete